MLWFVSGERSALDMPLVTTNRAAHRFMILNTYRQRLHSGFAGVSSPCRTGRFAKPLRTVTLTRLAFLALPASTFIPSATCACFVPLARSACRACAAVNVAPAAAYRCAALPAALAFA
jgi:hypothetical protein